MTTTGSWRPTALPWRSRARRPCGRSNNDPFAQGAVGLTLDHGRAESPQVLNRTYGPQANQSRNGFPQTSIGQIPLQLASLQRDIGRATAGTSTRSQEVDAGQQTVIRRFSAKRLAVRLFDVRSSATAFRCKGSVEEAGIFLPQVFFRTLYVDVQAKARSLQQIDHRVLHYLLGQSNDDVGPPWVGGARIFEGNIVRG